MKISLHRKFLKGYKKLNNKDKKRFKERRDLFSINPFDFKLNNHQLNGKYIKYRSININSDLRVLYKRKNKIIVFFTIDTHSNLYK